MIIIEYNVSINSRLLKILQPIHNFEARVRVFHLSKMELFHNNPINTISI